MKAAILTAALAGLAFGQARYPGTLDPVPAIVDESWGTFLFKPDPARPGVAWAGTMPEVGVRVAVVEPAEGPATLEADADRDGRFSAMVPFEPAAGRSGVRSACFETAIPGKSFARVPACVRIGNRAKTVHPDGARTLDLGVFPWVTATVQVGARRVQVGYEYDLRKDRVLPSDGWLGMHEARDGPVEFRGHSPEVDCSDRERVVFRVGDVYLSTESVDLKSRRVVLRSHPAADYIRVELTPGTAMPDLAFDDLAGKAGSLSEYRGRYLLIDVWSPGCGPCLGEFGLLKAALARFEARGFAILGLLGEAEAGSARRVEAENRLTWRTAASPAAVRFAKKRLRVASWPTHVLLDPQGRIVSADPAELRGEGLSITLDRLLPVR